MGGSYNSMLVSTFKPVYCFSNVKMTKFFFTINISKDEFGMSKAVFGSLSIVRDGFFLVFLNPDAIEIAFTHKEQSRSQVLFGRFLKP